MRFINIVLPNLVLNSNISSFLSESLDFIYLNSEKLRNLMSKTELIKKIVQKKRIFRSSKKGC